jgi:hypothetical protein
MLLLLLHKVVEVMMVLNFLLYKAAAELEDANIHVVIAEAEHVRCADMDANALANVQEDASVLLALAAQENVSAVLKDAMVVGANVKVF